MASFLSIRLARHIFTPLEIKSQTKEITSNNYYDLLLTLIDGNMPKVHSFWFEEGYDMDFRISRSMAHSFSSVEG